MGRIDSDKSIKWHFEVLPGAAKQALVFFSTQAWLRKTQWYLAGGTALAIQVGHRSSADLDFFTPQKTFNLEGLLGHLPKDTWITRIAKEKTVYGALFEAKASFIAYPFFIPKEKYNWYGAVRILDPRDIAVMKIVAISQRGRKRDFVDLYWYLTNRESLPDILARLPTQYPTVAHDYHHIIKALMYFEDAEKDPMPKIFFNATWKEIKKYFQSEVPKIAREFLGFKK